MVNMSPYREPGPPAPPVNLTSPVLDEEMQFIKKIELFKLEDKNILCLDTLQKLHPTIEYYFDLNSVPLKNIGPYFYFHSPIHFISSFFERGKDGYLDRNKEQRQSRLYLKNYISKFSSQEFCFDFRYKIENYQNLLPQEIIYGYIPKIKLKIKKEISKFYLEVYNSLYPQENDLYLKSVDDYQSLAIIGLISFKEENDDFNFQYSFILHQIDS